MLYVLGIVAVNMRVAGAQECQERQSGHRAIGFRSRASRALSRAGRGSQILMGTKLGRVPSAVRTLISGQPAERRLDGRFTLRRAAAQASDLAAIRRDAI